jgi:hypothetical protein
MGHKQRGCHSNRTRASSYCLDTRNGYRLPGTYHTITDDGTVGNSEHMVPVKYACLLCTLNGTVDRLNLCFAHLSHFRLLVQFGVGEGVVAVPTDVPSCSRRRSLTSYGNHVWTLQELEMLSLRLASFSVADENTKL